MPIRFLLIILLTGFMPIAHSAGFWGNQGFGEFCEELPSATQAALAQAAKQYFPVLANRTHLTLSTIKVARFEDIDPVLARAAKQGMGTLEVFTQTELGRLGSCALFLDKATLAAVDAKYALHGIWQLSVPRTQGRLKEVRMDYLIVGQGHLIIGYPDETEVKIEDDRGVLRSYRYEPYISAEIVNSETARGLFDVLTLATPNAPFKPFQGPSGAEIHAFQTAGSDVLVKFNWGVDQESRVRKTPIELKDSYLAQK